MPTFLHILLFKNKMFWKIPSQNTSSLIKNIGAFIVFSSFAVGAYFFSQFITSYSLEKIGIGSFLFHRFISIIFFVFFITINLGNIVVSFSTLYRSPEVHFLLSQPISYSTIFLIKFLDNFFYSSGTLFLVAFSVLLGYGTYFHLPWYFYPLIMGGVLVPFMFLAGCIAVLVLLLLMKLASKIHFKKLIVGVVALYCVQVFVYFKITSPIRLVEQVMQHYPNVDVYFGSLDAPLTKLLPNFWVSQILYFFVHNEMGVVATYVALLLGITIVVFLLVVIIGRKLFYSTWLTSLTIKALSVKNVERRNSFFSFEKKSHFSPQTEVILKKEYWQFLREPSQWIHFSVMMVLTGVFLLSVSSLNIKLDAPQVRGLIYLVIFVFNTFLLTSITLRFAFPMMSLEGSAYWTVRSAPIFPSTVYHIKKNAIMIILLLLGISIGLFSNLSYTYLPMLPIVILLTMLCIVFTIVHLNFGMGSLYSNYLEKNPIRIASSQGATLTFLLSIVYLIVVIVLYFIPIVELFTAYAKKTLLYTEYLYYAFGILLCVSLLIVFIIRNVGLQALKRDF